MPKTGHEALEKDRLGNQDPRWESKLKVDTSSKWTEARLDSELSDCHVLFDKYGNTGLGLHDASELAIFDGD